MKLKIVLVPRIATIATALKMEFPAVELDNIRDDSSIDELLERSENAIKEHFIHVNEAALFYTQVLADGTTVHYYKAVHRPEGSLQVLSGTEWGNSIVYPRIQTGSTGLISDELFTSILNQE